MVARQLIALGDFVVANLDFFLQFSRPETPNTFLPPLDGTAMGAAAENRPVIGSWEIGPDEALLVEVSPPRGSLLELLAGQSLVGDHRLRLATRAASTGTRPPSTTTAMLRTVIAHEDPGVANWLDTAGHSAGPIILRCVRTETAPVPTTRVIKFSDVAQSVPAGTRRVTAGGAARHAGGTPARREQAVLPMTPVAGHGTVGAKEEDRHGSRIR